MKKLLPLMALLAGLTLLTPLQAQPLQLFTSVIPIQRFIEQVGGEHVEAHALIRPGQDPHSYHPTPRQIESLSTADLYISAGSAFDQGWIKRIQSANPTMKIVDATQGLDHASDSIETTEPTEEKGEHNHHHHHHHEAEIDPHYWTSPLLAIALARNIQNALITIDPQHQPSYRQNFHLLSQQLHTLDSEIELLLNRSTSDTFMVQHPVWGHFAQRYGLRQIAIEDEGKSPRAKTLAAIIDSAKASQVRAIFVQPQFSQRAAQQLAKEIGGRVTTIDPLAANYIDNLRHFAIQLSAGGEPK